MQIYYHLMNRFDYLFMCCCFDCGSILLFSELGLYFDESCLFVCLHHVVMRYSVMAMKGCEL